MSSLAQIDANRTNARKSTGPKSAAGKLASSRNSLRHGLSGKQVVIQGEDPAEFEALRQDLHESYNPANAAESLLVEEIAQSFWRLQRARALEAECFKMIGAGADPIIAFRAGSREFDNIRRYMSTIERAYHRAVQQLEHTQADRRRQERQTPPQAEIGFVSQRKSDKTPAKASRIVVMSQQEPNQSATIKFDPLPSPTATSNTQ